MTTIERTTKRIICPVCKGKGEVVKIDPVMAFASFGFSALFDMADPVRCNYCNGMGYTLEETKRITR